MSDGTALLKRLINLSSECPRLTHTFNFIVGAVYALGEAVRLGHRDRSTYDTADRSDHVRRLKEAAAALAVGSTPDPTWIAGFYYNAAIMRIDACYDRFLWAMLEAAGATRAKPMPGQSATDAMARQLERTLRLNPPLARNHLAWVRKEANNLKHNLFGQEPSHARERSAQGDLDNAAAAIYELVAAMERPEIRPRLASHFGDLPPP